MKNIDEVLDILNKIKHIDDLLNSVSIIANKSVSGEELNLSIGWKEENESDTNGFAVGVNDLNSFFYQYQEKKINKLKSFAIEKIEEDLLLDILGVIVKRSIKRKKDLILYLNKNGVNL